MRTSVDGVVRAGLVGLTVTFSCAAQDESADAGEDRDAEAVAAWDAEASHVSRMEDLEWSGLARAESRFGLELLHHVVAQDPSSNHLVAPLGAFSLLNLVAEGASAPLRDRLDALLHVQALDRVSLRRALGTLHQSLATRGEASIDVALSVWLAEGATPSPEFVTVARDGYGATVASVDPSGPGAIAAINEWAETATDGAIPSVLDVMPPGSRMLALVVTSFTASWLHHFEEHETELLKFTDADGRTSKVPMMHVFQDFAYEHDRNLGAQIVRLPTMAWADNAAEEAFFCSLYVVLPDPGLSIQSILGRLVEQPLSWLFSYRRLARAQERSGHVRLPRFRHVSELDLLEVIGGMGLGDAFVKEGAPGIASGPGPAPLDLRETTTINVDEQGVAATSADLAIVFSSPGETSSFSFVADRPFIYVLFDEFSGALLYAGVMAKPE